MGVLLIAMIAAPQVMYTNNVNMKNEQLFNMADVPVEIHNYFMEEIQNGYWLDAKANGVNLNLSGYNVYTAVNLQFNFSFYSVYEFDTMYVSGYGYISFIDSTPTYSGATLPWEGDVCIAPYWEYMPASNNTYVWSTPEFCAIQYDNVQYYMGSEIGSFEVVLYSNGTINFNYLEINNVEDPTIGLNFGDGEYYNEYPPEELDGVTDFTLQFYYIVDGPELEVEIDGPRYTEIGNNYTYTATTWNLGTTNETDLSFTLYLNDVIVNSTTIAEIGLGGNATITYNYTVSEEGLNVFRATIEEVPNEHTYANNEATLPFISSIERRYAIFQDEWPWPYSDNPESTAIALNEFGIPYDIYPHTDMGNVSLDNYTRIIISSSQPTIFYERLYDNMTWFEDFAAAGGILEIHAADQSSEQWVNGTLPGDLRYVYETEEFVNIVTPWHQLVNYPYSISDDDLDNWNSAIHGHLVNLTRPVQVILDNNAGDPVLIEFPFGEGHFIVTTQTVEWSYDVHNSHMLDNLLLYRPQETDHDVLVNLNAPNFAKPGEEIALDLFVTNWGTDTEYDVVVTVHANEELLYSHTITAITAGAIFHEEFYWAPSFPGTYELAAFVEPVTSEELIENNFASRDILVRSEVGTILWDEGHGCYSMDYFSNWVRELESIGYRVDGTTDPLNETILADYSALICAEPFMNYWSNETDAIQAFVLNGGGFFAIGDSYQAPLNNLTLFAGIEWLPEPGENWGATDNITEHQVTDGVEEVYFDSPVSRLNLTSPAINLIYHGNASRFAVSEVGEGRVAAIAEDNCLDDYALYESDNLRLGLNTIDWLTEGRQYNIITNVVQVPEVVNSTQSVDVTCDVIDFEGVDTVTLYYRVDGGSWQSVSMNLVTGDSYQGTIPAQPAGSEVEYYISATNVLGLTTIDNNNGDFYSYTVTTPSTTPTTTTTPTPGPNTTLLIVVIAGAAGVAIVIVIVFLSKKKTGE